MKAFRFLILALIAGMVALPSTPMHAQEKKVKIQVVGGDGATPAKADDVTPPPDKQLGPVACVAVRLQVFKQLRAQGHSVRESFQINRGATDELITGLVPEAEKVSSQKFGAIGDGKILQAIIDFFQSPQGQQLITALVQMLIHLLVPVASLDSPSSTWQHSIRSYESANAAFDRPWHISA